MDMGTQGEQPGPRMDHYPGPFRMTGHPRAGSGLDGARRAAWWKCGEDREQGQKWQRRTGLVRAAFPVFLQLFHLVGEQSLSLLGGVCVCGCGRAFSLSLSLQKACPLLRSSSSHDSAGKPDLLQRMLSPHHPTHTHRRLPARLPFPRAPTRKTRGKDISDPSQRTQSGERGGLKAQPPLLRGGMTFPGSETLAAGQSQGPWRSGTRGWGGRGGWKQPAPPAALHLKVTSRPQLRDVASCPHYQRGPGFSPRKMSLESC